MLRFPTNKYLDEENLKFLDNVDSYWAAQIAFQGLT